MNKIKEGLHPSKIPECRLIIPTAMSIIAGTFYPAILNAELYFPPEMVSSDPALIADLSRFEKEGSQLPGNYLVDIFLNEKFTVSKTIPFITENESKVTGSDGTQLKACLSRDMLAELGVKAEALATVSVNNDSQCVSPDAILTGASTRFDFQKMRLYISIPQAAMQSTSRGFIPPERWDNGINAAKINYSFNGNENHNHYGTNRSLFLNLNSGVNIGAWRFRDYRTWHRYENPFYHNDEWQSLKTYASRPVVPLRSEFVVGESVTNGEIFDSVSFRGFQLYTDDNMFPDSLRGYAPVIRGSANTNATVTVRQNGYALYQTFVSPGAFQIDDLYPVYSSGDLEITIKEANGEMQVFTIPYSSVPILQREGRLKYSVTAGKLNTAGQGYNTPSFTEASLIWGLPKDVTLYGGVQVSESYLSATAGAGFNMGAPGAISMDVTQANSTLNDDSQHKGQSLRFLYARSLNSLGTTFQLTGYRYSTKGFYTLNETAMKHMQRSSTTQGYDELTGKPIENTELNGWNLYNHRKAKIQASISQRAGSLGSVYLSGVRQTYWNQSGTSTSLQAGINGSAAKVNYNLMYSYNLNYQYGRAVTDQSVTLMLSVPLSSLFQQVSNSQHQVYASYSVTQNGVGGTSHNTNLSGTYLEDNNLGWNVSQSHEPHQGNNGSAGLHYMGNYGNSDFGYSYGQDYKQFNYGLSGGVILHEDGLTFGQPSGETSVLIAAPGVSGARIENESGVRTDWRGYTIKPYAAIYRENRIALDTLSLNEHTDVEQNVRNVVPTRGAIVRASFKGHIGQRALISLSSKGKPLPFGSIVSIGERTGIADEFGQVYLSGLPQEGTLTAEWGKGKCTAPYRLLSDTEKETITRLSLDCH